MFDFGLVRGISYRFDGNWTVNLRYNYDLIPVYDIKGSPSGQPNRNLVFQLGLGYTF